MGSCFHHCKASAYNAGDPSSIPGSGSSPGEGTSNPLQYSCLENPTNGGAWWATVHGVAESRTRLSNFHFSLPTTATQPFALGSPSPLAPPKLAPTKQVSPVSLPQLSGGHLEHMAHKFSSQICGQLGFGALLALSPRGVSQASAFSDRGKCAVGPPAVSPAGTLPSVSTLDPF